MAGDVSVDTAVRPWLFPGPQTTGRAQISELNHLEQWDLAGNLEIYGGLFLVVINDCRWGAGDSECPARQGESCSRKTALLDMHADESLCVII